MMSESMNSVRGRAHADKTIPPNIAALIVKLANEVDAVAQQAHEASEAMRRMSERHDNQMTLLRKEIDGLKGIHGAKR